jgi:hypothetical protein
MHFFGHLLTSEMGTRVVIQRKEKGKQRKGKERKETDETYEDQNRSEVIT